MTSPKWRTPEPRALEGAFTTRGVEEPPKRYGHHSGFRPVVESATRRARRLEQLRAARNGTCRVSSPWAPTASTASSTRAIVKRAGPGAGRGRQCSLVPIQLTPRAGPGLPSQGMDPGLPREVHFISPAAGRRAARPSVDVEGLGQTDAPARAGREVDLLAAGGEHRAGAGSGTDERALGRAALAVHEGAHHGPRAGAAA